MAGITRRDFVNYALLPGFRPRLQELFISGFRHIPFFMALVYQAVRLLPQGHPYTLPENLGRFGIRHVIGEAANHLVFRWKNLDQIVLFSTMLVGVVVVLIQVILLALSLLSQPVMASMPTNYRDFFITQDAPHDLAFMMLDLTFGVPEFFGSCVDQTVATPCVNHAGAPITGSNNQWILAGLQWPFPIHQGMHQMFQMYSIGLLIVATMITCYFIVTILMETAESGTAFGKRFNRVWAPIRIVVAFGLLIPVGYGLNSSQYIVLYAAKFGSGFATNGWKIFNDVLSGTYVDSQKLISQPKIPEINGFLQFMYTAATCYELERLKNKVEITPYAVRDSANQASNALPITRNVTYQQLINFTNGDSQAIIRFGIRSRENYSTQKGFVKPICGEVILTLQDPRSPSNAANPPDRGPEIMQRLYFAMIKELWYVTFDGQAPARNSNALSPYTGEWFTYNTVQRYTQWDADPNAQEPPPQYKSDLLRFYKEDIKTAMLGGNLSTLDAGIGTQGVIKEMVNSGKWAVTPELRQKGWAGAAIWYNKIAEMNGVVSSSVFGTPIPSVFPTVLEKVKEEKQQQDQDVPISQRFKPELAEQQDVPASRPEDAQMQTALWQAFDYWQSDDHATSSHTKITNNAVFDFINSLLGSSGLYSLRENPDIHPLAQLVGVGRSLIEATTRNFGIATGGAVGGRFLEGVPGKLAGATVSIIMTLVIVIATMGFLLFYVVPLLPFIYFYFALGGWVKAIFEAMVGAPLWALAHIRIDGNGLPGNAAVNGYMLIFEIFLRPILIIFGFLASISIFAAMVTVLNQVWDLVVQNVSGFDIESELSGTGPSMIDYIRGPVDKFFFTVIYAIVVYMVGMSSFKLIDIIPSSILRWMGQGIQTFNDMKEGAAESFMGTTSVGAQQAIDAIGGGLKGGLEKLAKSGGG